VDVTVDGDGSDLRRLIADRPDIFAAYLQFKPQKGSSQFKPQKVSSEE
jgi:hypothetical protein